MAGRVTVNAGASTVVLTGLDATNATPAYDDPALKTQVHMPLTIPSGAARTLYTADSASITPTVTDPAGNSLSAVAAPCRPGQPINLGPFSAYSTSVFTKGTQTTVKPSGDTYSGTVDWVNDSTTGYLLHLHAGPNSTTNAAAIGIGTDQGHGGGIMISHKNDNYGLNIVTNPGAAIGAYLSGYSGSPVLWVDQYAGSAPIMLRAMNGQGYADGVTTAGSTTFMSASGSFTAGDVGQGLVQLTSKGATDLLGCIPGGTTVAAYVSPTQVTMSQPATYSGTGVLFRVGGRAMPTSQALLRALDTDGSTVLGEIRRDGIFWSAPVAATTNNVAQPALKATGKTSQTADIFQAFTAAVPGTPALAVSASGKAVAQFASYFNNAGDTTSSTLYIDNASTSAAVPSVQIHPGASQAADLLQIQNNAGTPITRVSKVGTVVTRATAPVLADLADGEMALVTDASGNLKVYSRVAGVLKSGTVTVA